MTLRGQRRSGINREHPERRDRARQRCPAPPRVAAPETPGRVGVVAVLADSLGARGRPVNSAGVARPGAGIPDPESNRPRRTPCRAEMAGEVHRVRRAQAARPRPRSVERRGVNRDPHRSRGPKGAACAIRASELEPRVLIAQAATTPGHGEADRIALSCSACKGATRWAMPRRQYRARVDSSRSNNRQWEMPDVHGSHDRAGPGRDHPWVLRADLRSRRQAMIRSRGSRLDCCRARR